ncbi:PH domain-containing protein [Adhaeribacter soli]|uniref:Bacterial Pleckstrin homology domain-containing protein n=1 Tax=Adhaeribacter soli TaxID=2607655 RepID=A0A5N1IUC4_9BACT|nr:PH domain-containing protein [Adhaeribacter soli]KAA9333805.1 hypothetical protein F0P94_11225 [Adhaeribacter soli]
MKYKASLDKLARIITLLAIAFPVVLLFFLDEATIPVVILSGVLVLSYGFAPQYYLLTPEELVIKRLFKDVHLKRSEIKTVELLPEARKLRWTTVRTFGSGGFFGYFGKFWNRTFGGMTWYLNNFRNVVLVETYAGKKLLLSPDNPDMIDNLQNQKPTPLAA